MNHFVEAQRALAAVTHPALHARVWPRLPVHPAARNYVPHRCFATNGRLETSVPVRAADGFEYVKSEIVNGEEVFKPGHIALRAGAWLRLRFSSRFQWTNQSQPAQVALSLCALSLGPPLVCTDACDRRLRF